MPVARLTRAYLRAIVRLNSLAKSAAVRGTRMTGKSRLAIHPKHLAGLEEQHHWYLDSIAPGMTVLDAGCGNGVHTLRVAARAATTVGLDYDWRHLRTGRALASGRENGRFALLFGRVDQTLPFAAGRFDAALLLDVIEHLHRRLALLRELHRVLRPDGLLFLSAPNRATAWKRRLATAGLFAYTDPDHKVEYTWSELQEGLRAGGFAVVAGPLPIVFDTPWSGLIDLTGAFSLTLYRRLTRWKLNMAARFPAESIGWRVVCRRTDTA